MLNQLTRVTEMTCLLGQLGKPSITKLQPVNLNYHVKKAIELGGTVTGEHGVGQGKRKYMLKELGNAVDIMKQVKNAFDPDKIMNPGKLFL